MTPRHRVVPHRLGPAGEHDRSKPRIDMESISISIRSYFSHHFLRNSESATLSWGEGHAQCRRPCSSHVSSGYTRAAAPPDICRHAGRGSAPSHRTCIVLHQSAQMLCHKYTLGAQCPHLEPRVPLRHMCAVSALLSARAPNRTRRLPALDARSRRLVCRVAPPAWPIPGRWMLRWTAPREREGSAQSIQIRRPR